ncbi:MAG: CBS domain-containing protein [Nitrospinota bacterium]|jgi:CBS domain-containing protein|nr:CBS domain-containing protein [Nitrospinota bacterium]MDP6483486.1 CBS domain-containing protein [Nitrospinota bacterium]
MKVRDVFQSITEGADVVHENDSIPRVIQRVSEDYKTRAVFVLNDAEQLVGIISVRDLMRVAGARYLQQDTRTVLPYLTAAKAGDIMQTPYSVSSEDEIQDALRLAVEHDLKDIPVVEEGKVMGDLNCFEILLNIGFE